MSLFSFLKKETETIMVFSDHGLQVLQFKRLKDKYKILGFNELALTDGLVKNGEIVNIEIMKINIEEFAKIKKLTPLKELIKV